MFWLQTDLFLCSLPCSVQSLTQPACIYQVRSHVGLCIVFHDMLSLAELTRPISAVVSLSRWEVGGRYLFHQLVCLTFNWQSI